MRVIVARRWPLLAAVALAVLLAGTAAASTVRKLDFGGLTRLSTNVVVGRVGGAESTWTKDGAVIVTLTTVEVAAEWKGSTGAPAIVVRTPGGQVGDYRIEISGTPSLPTGETVLLFLEKNPDGSFGVVSFAQGSYRVLAGTDGSLRVASDPNAKHLRAVSEGGIATVAPVAAPLAAVQLEIEKALRPATEAPAEEDENVVPLVGVERGGGR